MYINSHRDYIKRECSIPIEQFNIPDEKEKDTDEEIDR